MIMKELSLEKMENVKGGASCGTAGRVMAIAGGVLAIVALANPITGLVGGLAAAYGTSFSIAGVGCAIAEFF
jgi:hypothetical protein